MCLSCCFCCVCCCLCSCNLSKQKRGIRVSIQILTLNIVFSHQAGIAHTPVTDAASSQTSQNQTELRDGAEPAWTGPCVRTDECWESLREQCLMNSRSHCSSLPKNSSRLINWKNTCVPASSLHPEGGEEGRRGNGLLFLSFTLLLSFFRCFASRRRRFITAEQQKHQTQTGTMIYLFILSLHFLFFCFFPF